MSSISTGQRWLLALLSCVMLGGAGEAQTAAPHPPGHGPLTVLIMVRGPNQQRQQSVEDILAQAFIGQGYQVIDADTVTQSLRRHTYLRQQSDVEAAKRLGAGLGAEIVVSGEAQSSVVEKSYTLLEGKKLMVGRGDITVRAVLTRTGQVLGTEQAAQRKPNDTTGLTALKMAAESIAKKLVQNIATFLHRDALDYRLVVHDLNASQAAALQEGIRDRVQGVRQVDAQRSMQDSSELRISVGKEQDLAFKQSLFSQLSSLGPGPFEIVAREGEMIYLRQAVGSTPTQPGPGSRQPPPAMSQTKYHLGYRKSWAVLIGINEYQQWPQLRYAVHDARAVEALVRKLGFDEVITVLDREATQQRILRILGDDLYNKTEDDDRVFIFFAGHGQTQDLLNDKKDGYIIPVDGDLNNYYSTAISMQQLQGLADRIRAKHIFYAMDACFSGLLLRNFRGAAPARSPLQLTTAPTRQVLTAGAEGEKVVEAGGHGLFTKSLLSGLEGQGDLNHDGYITATELSQYITSQVLAESRNAQNPLFGRLGDGQGEFVFALK